MFLINQVSRSADGLLYAAGHRAEVGSCQLRMEWTRGASLQPFSKHWHLESGVQFAVSQHDIADLAGLPLTKFTLVKCLRADQFVNPLLLPVGRLSAVDKHRMSLSGFVHTQSAGHVQRQLVHAVVGRFFFSGGVAGHCLPSDKMRGFNVAVQADRQTDIALRNLVRHCWLKL